MPRIRIAPEYYPLPSQRCFHDAGPVPITPDAAQPTTRYRAYVGGLGSGKTLANVVEALRWAASYPGCSGIMVSPTYQQLKRTVLVEFQRQCRLAGGFLKNFNKSDWLAEFVNGSAIWFGYAEHPDSLRGPNLSWFSFDEPAQVRDDGMAFQVLQGRIRDPRYPQGGWLTTTPRGRNWVWRYFDVKQDTEGKPLEDAADYTLVKCRTEDNTNLPASYVASLRSSYVGQFARQELDGEFVSFEGVIYPGLAAQVGEFAGAARRVVAGVDWGWTNSGVIIVIKQDTAGVLHVTREEYATERPVVANDGIEDWVTVAKRINKEERVDTWYCDPSEPDNIAAFRRAGLHAVQADNAVIPGISAVSAAQAAGMTISAECPKLSAELDAYCWKRGRDGKMRNDEPEKQADHGPDGLRYGVMGFGHKVIRPQGAAAPVTIQRRSII